MPWKGSCLVMLRGNHDNWVLSQAAAQEDDKKKQNEMGLLAITCPTTAAGLLDSAKETKSKVSNSAVTDEFSDKRAEQMVISELMPKNLGRLPS
ncbi:hypothetical protein WN943_015980 [Citrus x changshan-huyou]